MDRELEEGAADNVSISITDKFDNLSNPSSECCIFRMYDHLRRQNEKAYEPSIVAIGPYHHGKPNLQEMEFHKLRYLQRFLSGTNATNVNRYVMAIRELEGRARNCYSETYSLGLDLDSDQFVEMMLLDGFFIIELFHNFEIGGLRDENDNIFQSDEILYAIRRDLILLENQLPFFILDCLFHMSYRDSEGIIPIALGFLKYNAPDRKLEGPNGIPINNIKHLLDLIHNWWCSKFPETPRNVKFEFINSAIELQEDGVQFKKAEGSNLFDVKFISGILEIPLLSITDVTEPFLTNLVAFELCPSYHKQRYVCDYIVFMYYLINSSNDVQVLRRSRIIDSWVGDDAEIYSMWYKLSAITMTDTESFTYSQVFNDVNDHCKQRRHLWMAKLKRNYFNSPWALISFVAATILLLLTVAQTIFTAISFGKGF